MKRLKPHFVLVLVNLVLLFVSIFLFSKTKYPAKIQERLGISEYVTANNVSQNSWNKSIEQLNYDADIVFFGDSLTIRTDWQSAFPEYKIYNFGCYGDTLTELRDRSHVIQHLMPEKIFILGGINTISSGYPIDKSCEIYRQILDKLISENNNAEIFVQSILPVRNNKELNEKIIQMNASIEGIANEYDVKYVDLHHLFVSNGELAAEYTVDGIHLSDAGKTVWIEAISDFVAH